jgi:hypothetical protein
MVGVMTRIVAAATAAVFVAMFLMAGAGAQAQTAPSRIQLAQATQPDAAEPAASRRRPLRRLPIYPRYQGEPDGVYPRYYPGRNAVRDCTATYVQENRPSGTVIVPRMNCFWRRG